jgi:hypothetical protein
MSLLITIFSLIAAWLTVAIAMLWGVLRIARRRHSSGHRIAAERKHVPSVFSLSSR